MIRVLLIVLMFLLPLGVLATVTEEEIKRLISDFQEPLAAFVSTGFLKPAISGGIGHFAAGFILPFSSVKYIDPVKDESETLWGTLPCFGLTAGIVDGVDIGAKLGYIPKIHPIKSGNFYGGKINVGILKEGLTTPGIFLSITYNKFELTLKEENKWSTEWNMSTFGMKLLASKRLGIIHPYCGIGFERYGGKVKYEIPLTRDEVEKKGRPLRILVGCRLNILPFVFAHLEYNRLGEDNIYAVSMGIGR